MQIEFDKEGFLKNLEDWNEDVAITIAKKEGLKLNEKHWEIIVLLRNFHKEFERSPNMRALSNYIKKNEGPEKAKSIYLLSLFPDSPAKLGSKIAGLPKPENCL